jgi:hypothetical protein
MTPDNRPWLVVPLNSSRRVGRLARGEPLINEVVDGY